LGFLSSATTYHLLLNHYQFLYTITVQAGAMRNRVRVSDTSMPEALRPLINELATLAAVH
ncbi:MAG: protealysin inhibitor emfourin, partial [Chloroflexota bacterium]